MRTLVEVETELKEARRRWDELHCEMGSLFGMSRFVTMYPPKTLHDHWDADVFAKVSAELKETDAEVNRLEAEHRRALLEEARST